jgi:hypothetical protein
MKAYIKDERIKKSYRGYLSFDHPEGTDLVKNENPVQRTETDMHTHDNVKKRETLANDDGNVLVKNEPHQNSYTSQLIHTIQTGSFLHEEDAQKHYDSIMQGSNKKHLDNLRMRKKFSKTLIFSSLKLS